MIQFVLVSAAALLTGCSANGPAFALEKTDPNHGLVYFYRPDTIVGCGAVPAIRIDEIEQGSLKNNGYLVCFARPGHRMIETTTSFGVKPLTMYLDVEGGNEYFLRWWYDTNGFDYSYHIGLVPKEDALPEIQHARKSE